MVIDGVKEYSYTDESAEKEPEYGTKQAYAGESGRYSVRVNDEVKMRFEEYDEAVLAARHYLSEHKGIVTIRDDLRDVVLFRAPEPERENNVKSFDMDKMDTVGIIYNNNNKYRDEDNINPVSEDPDRSSLYNTAKEFSDPDDNNIPYGDYQ